MVAYDRLDDDQKDFVDREIDNEGNIWIQGFAGSGKSVMLIHALRKKLTDNPNSNICVVVYTWSLIEMFKAGMAELRLPEVPIMTYHQFMRGNQSYEYIFCDEVQDLPDHVLEEMKRRSVHVHVAGDSNQSIFENTVSPNQIGDILTARPFVLSRIYRLTRSIMSAVSNLLPNLDIFSARRDMTRQDVSVRLGQAYDEEDEVRYVWEQATEATTEGYSAVVLLPKRNDIIKFANILLKLKEKPEWEIVHDQYDNPNWSRLNEHFRNNKIKAEYIGSRHGSLQNAEKQRNLILMTYHSAKGMDFDYVFLPFLSDDLYITPRDEETLFMVAMTRSKMNLFITYSGYLHHLVERFENSCQRIPLNEQNTTSENLDFDF